MVNMFLWPAAGKGVRMLGDILPSPVVAVEAFEDDPDVVLFPEGEAVIAKAVTKRRV
jgi:hypothetical protein